MNPRTVIVSLELVTDETVKVLRDKARWSNATDWAFDNTKVDQVQRPNVIKATKPRSRAAKKKTRRKK